jgi:hypothetical protein
MKLVEFNYKKSDGSVSNRAVIELVSPCAHVEGIDVSQLPEPEFVEFVQEFRQLKNQQHEDMMMLLAKHDLKHNYRRFIPNQMSNVVAEQI